MKPLSWILTILILAPLPSLAETMTSLSTQVLKPYDRMPGTVRIGVLGGWARTIGDMSENIASESGQTEPTGLTAGLTLGFGDGAVSFESGVIYTTLSGVTSVAESTDEVGDSVVEHRVLINSQYVGLPLWVKYNYIEKPLASFYLKGGAIPLLLVDQDRKELVLASEEVQDLSLSPQQVLLTAGFGGTAPINDHLAFVLDVMGFYSAIQEAGRAPYQGVIGAIGFSYDL